MLKDNRLKHSQNEKESLSKRLINITNVNQSSRVKFIMETYFWDVLMKQAKGMKLFILEKLLQDDSRE